MRKKYGKEGWNELCAEGKALPGGWPWRISDCSRGAGSRAYLWNVQRSDGGGRGCEVGL